MCKQLSDIKDSPMKALTPYLSILLLATLSFSGCSDKKPSPEEVQQEINDDEGFACMQENVLAPKWTCIPMVEDAYAGVGIVQKSAAGMGHMRRVALANGRSDLAQQIATEVKDKVETFTRTTGVSSSESVDNVATAVSKQIANVSLEGSKGINMWTAPSGALYMLVTVPKSSTNNQIRNNIKSSFKNDNALWQQYQAENAFEMLENEFSD